MPKDALIKSFNTWWIEEGKFITPNNSDWEETKRIMLIAWLNGAHIATTYGK